METKDSIVIDGLSKQYIKNAPFALKDLSLKVKKGEVFGFLGPNGAGKSTAIRLLLNFIQPSAGSAKIEGLDIINDSVAVRSKLGYLSGDFAVYEKMTGEQIINYMHSLCPPKRKGYAQELARTFKAHLHKPLRDLSKGNRQKIGIILAFMHEPDIYILDEPTDGIDPLMQETFYDLVAKTKKRGATFFISSHNLGEVRKICDRVAIIKDGVLVSQSTIADLALEAAQTFKVEFATKPPLAQLRKLKGVKIISHSANSVELHVHGPLAPLLSQLGKYNVTHLSSQELNLEDEFMRFYKTKESR